MTNGLASDEILGLFTGRAISREEFLEPFVAGKDVLDLGCTNTRPSGKTDRPESSLHGWLKGRASKILGVDLDPAGVAKLVAAGFDAVVGNAESLDLGRQFDCVVAGELIEHLSNPGQALACWRRHLRPGGVIVVTTCNPFYLKQVWKIIRYGHVAVHEQHTAWFDPLTLGRLMLRCEYELVAGAWLRRPRSFSISSLAAGARRYFSPNFAIAAK